MVVEQYEIVLVNLDPTIGSEIKKTRPCVIISPNEMNMHLDVIIIAPMTSTSKKYPTRISTSLNNKKGWIVIDQIRAIDKKRLVKVLGKLKEPEIRKVKEVIKETFVD